MLSFLSYNFLRSICNVVLKFFLYQNFQGNFYINILKYLFFHKVIWLIIVIFFAPPPPPQKVGKGAPISTIYFLVH